MSMAWSVSFPPECFLRRVSLGMETETLCIVMLLAIGYTVFESTTILPASQVFTRPHGPALISLGGLCAVVDFAIKSL